jgi:hypothetical protein
MEKINEKIELFELVEVPTQLGLAIKTPEGETLSQVELMVQIANELREIKKALVGN